MEARRGRGRRQRREFEGVVVRVGALLRDDELGDGRRGRGSFERCHGARAAAVAVFCGSQPAAVELEEETVEGLKV